MIAKIWHPTSSTLVSGEIGLPGCARIACEGAVDISPLSVLPRNRPTPAVRSMRRAVHVMVGNPYFILRRPLQGLGCEVHLVRGPVVEALMRPARRVETEIARQRSLHLPHRLVGVQVDVLVLDTAPQPLHEHIVDPAPLAVPAAANLLVGGNRGEMLVG